MANIIDVLKERGFIEALTSDELKEKVESPIKVYCGFDPSSDSLHLGNLVAIMGLKWFQKFGHYPVVIVGGATGMIGDPSGKAHERALLDQETIEKNLKGIQANLENVLGKGDLSFQILNNYDWFKKFSLIDYLRDVGKQFRLSQMLAKDSVKNRLETEEGMSFTEFCYQTLQGYDFLYLYQNLGVSVQMGGSDQWGNITAGIELIRKVLQKSAYGITFPILTQSDGKKFGKSEKGAIWLSQEKLSPYEFYQYLFRVSDKDVIKMLTLLTFLDMQEIRYMKAKLEEGTLEPNAAQKRLAEEVTKLIHGEDSLQVALKVTEAAAPGSETTLDEATLESIAKDMPNAEVSRSQILGTLLIDLIVQLHLLPSKGEVTRLIKNGGLYLNNSRIVNKDKPIQEEDLIGGRLMLIALGKKNKILLRIS